MREIYYSEGFGSKHSIKILRFFRFNQSIIKYRGQLVYQGGDGLLWEIFLRSEFLCNSLVMCHVNWGVRQGTAPGDHASFGQGRHRCTTVETAGFRRTSKKRPEIRFHTHFVHLRLLLSNSFKAALIFLNIPQCCHNTRTFVAKQQTALRSQM